MPQPLRRNSLGIAVRPKFMVKDLSGTSNVTGTYIVFNTTVLNVGNHWDTGTNRFTAPVSGYYYFHVHTFVDASNTTSSQIELHKNGSASWGSAGDIRNYTADIHGSYGPPLTIQATVELSAGDYVQVYTGIGLHANSASYFGGFLID